MAALCILARLSPDGRARPKGFTGFAKDGGSAASPGRAGALLEGFVIYFTDQNHNCFPLRILFCHRFSVVEKERGATR